MTRLLITLVAIISALFLHSPFVHLSVFLTKIINFSPRQEDSIISDRLGYGKNKIPCLLHFQFLRLAVKNPWKQNEKEATGFVMSYAQSY